MAINGYASTTTWGYGNWQGTSTMPTNIYSLIVPVIEQATESVQEFLERMKRAAGRFRRREAFWPSSDVPPLAPAACMAARAHRRTIVPRGTVSWIRAGTRRPL